MPADKFDRFDRDAPFWLKFIDQNGIGKFNERVANGVRAMTRIEGSTGQPGLSLVAFIDSTAAAKLKAQLKRLDGLLADYYSKHGKDPAQRPRFRLRKHTRAWHITLWGVVYPHEFRCKDAEDVTKTVKALIKSERAGTFKIAGFGFMGFGGLAARVSQPASIDRLRRKLEDFCYPCSKERYFSSQTGNVFDYVANKAMVGQLAGPIDAFGRKALEAALAASRGFPPITVQCKVASLVAYENVYLDKVTSRANIRLASTQAEERAARESEDAFLLRRSKRVHRNMCELDGQCGAEA